MWGNPLPAIRRNLNAEKTKEGESKNTGRERRKVGDRKMRKRERERWREGEGMEGNDQ